MQIPAEYAATLAHVQDTFPGAMIAGGCLRDLDNGRPVKDVDIFIPNTSRDIDEIKVRVTAHLAPESELVGVMGCYESWATEECIGVFDVKNPALDYQLICLATGADTVLPRMDFGICRISWDGSEIHRTDEYHQDKHNERFTLIRCDDSTQLDRSLARYERLRQKYVGWPLVFSGPITAVGWRNPFEASVTIDPLL